MVRWISHRTTVDLLISCFKFRVRIPNPNAGCSMLDARCSMLDLRCW
ncbi:MAG: hypothetical protein AB1797_12255 [bacterium]